MRIPRRGAKNLASVPPHELDFWLEFTAPRASKQRVVAIPKPPGSIVCSMHFVGDENLESSVAWRQTERAPIKRLVVNTAQRQPIRHRVRTAG